MNIRSIKRNFPHLLNNGIVPFLWGSQGIGKTSIVRQIAKENGFDSVILLNLASQDVGDLVGVLTEVGDGTVKHSRPSWFPISGKHLILLDEFNRAHPDVLQSMYNFVLEGKLHTHQLPKDCKVVCTGNYQNENFTVTDISDNALLSRFCHIDVKPTVEEFIVYLEAKNEVHMADFFRENADMLDSPSFLNKFDFSAITPDRRAWAEFILPLSKVTDMEDSERYELYQGLIGSVATTRFLAYNTSNFQKIRGDDILNKYSTVKEKVKRFSDGKDSRLDILGSAVDEIMLSIDNKELTNDQVSNIKEFMMDCPLELGLSVINKLTKSECLSKTKVLNDRAFVDTFMAKKVDTKKPEVKGSTMLEKASSLISKKKKK